ncbi:MAG: ATP-binding protein [Prevotella sp.]|jgi:predicted ATPase|nr:ATP-binding protein [Prevotella sp.]
MKILFKNLGVIKDISLDLSKKLIVFCGPNGTGKTYACYVAYEYLSHLINVKAILGDYFFDISKVLIEKKGKEAITLNYDNLFTIKKKYLDVININEVFGIQADAQFQNFKAVMEPKEDFINKIKSLSFDFKLRQVSFKKEKNSDLLLINLASKTFFMGKTDTSAWYNAQIGKYLCFQTLLKSYILPVERSAAYTFANELAKNKLSESELTTDETDKNRYPIPIQDILATAVDLNFIKKQESKYKWLAEAIEKDILHGNVLVSEDGELQFVPENTSGISLSFQLSASFIKNLSGLLIYLKHQANDNELLIIDEPELGLHPDNQILLARIFARLINNGIRLLISTHSDYIIRELNNLIMLSAENADIKRNAEKWGYKPDEKIKPEDVGAYLFNSDEQNRVKVESLSVDSSGFEVNTIDKAISRLNEISESIFYSLKYGENNEDEPIG